MCNKKEERNFMDAKARQKIVQLIFELETTDDNNISEKEKLIGELVKYCTINDLLEIDELVMEKLNEAKGD